MLDGEKQQQEGPQAPPGQPTVTTWPRQAGPVAPHPELSGENKTFPAPGRLLEISAEGSQGLGGIRSTSGNRPGSRSPFSCVFGVCLLFLTSLLEYNCCTVVC